MTPKVRFVVDAAQAGQRLDRFVADRCGLGRRDVRLLVARGLVQVDDRRCAKAHRLSAGEAVEVHGAAGGVPEPEFDAPLDVRLERADLVVVDKPAGQASAPLRPQEQGTLAGALLARYPEMRGVGHRPREPGLLHRLDTETSGLLVAARGATSFQALWQLLQAESLDKRYLAIVEGKGMPDRGVVEVPLEIRAGGQVVTCAERSGDRGVPARTSFQVLERRSRWALVEVVAKRAHRHQVRAHLASLGHPIAGDTRYGGGGRDALEGRHALHASYVAWTGGAAVEAFAVESPLPEDLAAFLRERTGPSD